MITQIVLDWLASVFAALVSAMPPLPVEFLDAVDWISDAGSWFATYLSAYGVIIPWGTLTMIVQWWLGLLVFWLAMLVLRAVLVALGR